MSRQPRLLRSSHSDPSGMMSPLFVAMCLAAAAGGKPNVVLIVADDQGYADIGYHNSTVLTPRIDQLARSGELLSCCTVCHVCRACALPWRSSFVLCAS